MDAVTLANKYYQKFEELLCPEFTSTEPDESAIGIFAEILSEITPIIQKELLLTLDDQIKTAAREAVSESLSAYIKAEEDRWLKGSTSGIEPVGIMPGEEYEADKDKS